MELSFGARLRAQRERRQVTLSAISAQTKIKLSLLEALECDDVSHWPSGLFRRAYVRDYARAIGLDPEAVVREFLEVYPDPMLVAQAAETAAKAEAAARSPEARFRRLLGAVLPRPPKTEPEPTFASVRVAGAFPAPMTAEANDAPDAPDGPFGVRTTETVSLSAVADLCTRLARVVDGAELAPLLGEAACLLDAVGVILWSWNPRGRVLIPALAHGYADGVLERLPCIEADAPNAVAGAFRSAESCAVDGGGDANGALVVPLLAPAGAIGVLSLELQNGREQLDAVRAAARILAAQLAALLGIAPAAEAVSA